MTGGQFTTYAINEYLGYSGSGTFTQTGGTNSEAAGIYLGYNSGSSGDYSLSGSGQLAAGAEYVGYSGTGAFSQSGGTNAINSLYGAGGNLYLAYNSGSNATYSLSGTGQLSVPTEYIGYASGATATFQQSGGTNTTSLVSIGAGDRYQLSGGTLEINGGGLVNQGTFDGGGSGSLNSANCIVDFSQGTLTGVGQCR